MAFLEGDDRILYVKISSTWVPLGCLESNSFSESAEMLPTTTRETGGWETSVPISQSYTIGFTGVQVKTIDNTKISYDSLKTYKRNKTLLDWKIQDAVSGLIDLGKAYISSLSETADAGDVLVFDGEMTGYGLPIQTTDSTPPSTPVLTLGAVDGDSVAMSWTAATDDVAVSYYKIYRNNVLYTTVIGSQLWYIDYGVVDGLSYNYNVSAVDTSDNEGGKSNKITSGIISKPTAEYFQFQDLSYYRFQDGTVFQFQ